MSKEKSKKRVYMSPFIGMICVHQETGLLAGSLGVGNQNHEEKPKETWSNAKTFDMSEYDIESGE